MHACISVVCLCVVRIRMSAASSASVYAQRVLEVDEDGSNFSPISGMAAAQLSSLADSLNFLGASMALKPHIRCANVFAKQFKMNDATSCPLEADEIAAIHLYTQESDFYPHLNVLLRARNRPALKPMLPYLRLLMTGLARLPFAKGVFYRGVTKDLSAKFKKGDMKVWWTVSSTTSDLAVLGSKQFLGTEGPRTQFIIHTHHAVNIKPFSAHEEEEEYVLPPGSLFTVSSVVDLGHGLHQVELKDTEDDTPLALAEFEHIPKWTQQK